MKKIITTLLCFLFCLVYIIGCRTTEDCIENKILGNIGNIVNTNDDEHSPSLLLASNELMLKYPDADTNNYLFYTTTSPTNETNERIYFLYLSSIEEGSFPVDDDFPLNDTLEFRNAGVPSFRYDLENGKLELYFAALPRRGKKSRDIYYAEKDLITDQWTTSKPLPINSDYWESLPTISSDGKILLFASNRPGSIGEIDIWATYRDADGTWTEPTNLGERINTKGINCYPMFAENYDFTFSTNGRGETGRKDFDIYYVSYDLLNEQWTNPKMFSYPINTTGNEYGSVIWNNRIFLSSDRRGGCGGKDIYSFQICGPVNINGNVVCDAKEKLTGKMYLYDENNNLVTQCIVDDNGDFDLSSVEPNKNYIIDYKNDCYPLKQNKYNFKAPCSDSTATKVVITMVMPEKSRQIELTDVTIQHFVTGYYRPNTGENLNSLKLGFSYNLFGKNNKSRYIENPEDNYNQYIGTVEGSLNDAVNYIVQLIEILDNKCSNQDNTNKLIVDVKGWADPRNINPDAEYLEDTIADEKFNVFVKKGQKMDNNLLSLLRAYFTAKYFETEIKNKYNLVEIADRIEWNIKGMGVDNSQTNEEGIKRRVEINLNFIE